MKLKALWISVLMCVSIMTFSQNRGKPERYFSNPIVSDSSSTILFPFHYNEGLLSNNKMAFWENYYANIVVYNFVDDQCRNLFPGDVFIQPFRSGEYARPYHPTHVPDNFSTNWIFLLVKNTDTNNNGRIDENDPTLLFICDRKGANLKALTDTSGNVVELKILEKSGIALVRVQRDGNGDKSFKAEDKVYDYRRVNLDDLSIGNPIQAGR